MNRKISVIAILSLTVTFIGCSESTSNLDANQAQFDLSEATFFNEFVTCSIGSKHTPEMMNAMISEWRELIDSDALVGAWIYLPASEGNTYPKNGWWELQWDSQDSAELAWDAWLNNDQVASWTEKYASVLDCDGPNRNAFEGVFPIETEEFGKFSDSGYFYSEVLLCNYVNGATSKNAKAFLESYTGAVRASEYEGTGYHFGNYYASNNPDADFLWGDLLTQLIHMPKLENSSPEMLSLRNSQFLMSSPPATKTLTNMTGGPYLSSQSLALRPTS